MKRLFYIASIVVLAFISCSKDEDFTPDCSGAAKSYTTDVAPVISSKCVSCHHQYNSYSGVYSGRSGIRSIIVSSSDHKNTSLTATQKNVVACWIDNGAVNN